MQPIQGDQTNEPDHNPLASQLQDPECPVPQEHEMMAGLFDEALEATKLAKDNYLDGRTADAIDSLKDLHQTTDLISTGLDIINTQPKD